MTQPELTPYPQNSPEAMLRVITLFIVSDGELAEAEIDVLDRLGVLKTLGMDREGFAQVFDTYCDDLIAHAGSSRYIGLADPEWVDAVLAAVTDPERRRFVAATLLHVANSDNDLADAERAVYRRMLQRWGLDIEELTAGS
jgi:uncharacterized tellurite resistance protein B-like protein